VINYDLLFYPSVGRFLSKRKDICQYLAAAGRIGPCNTVMYIFISTFDAKGHDFSMKNLLLSSFLLSSIKHHRIFNVLEEEKYMNLLINWYKTDINLW
jgi:hypothetical protein